MQKALNLLFIYIASLPLIQMPAASKNYERAFQGRMQMVIPEATGKLLRLLKELPLSTFKK